ncbi:NADP transhydrogenase subunit beta [Sphingobium sp. AM]|nr:NADP transhydrogenase subunit beta [Sphingobium sp. AM]OAP30992.1 NADP transhydrogenase subunit beta [Sphingobium sp. 20006FA]
MMEGVNGTILAGWSLAALLFAAALLAPLGGGLRRGAHLAGAAMMVAGAVTLYSHDVMALPQICAALIAGSAIGLALGRGMPRSALPSLMSGLIGQAGLAAVFIGGAALRDPHAFGLLDDATDRLRIEGAAAIGAAVACGAMACAGAAAVLWRGAAGRWHPLVAAAMLPATGGLVAAFIATPDLGRLLACIGAAWLAGWTVVKWALSWGTGPALALVGGFAGWSLAASAFLMENMPMAVAGGLAGAAGSLFGARLCGGAGRKGLADAGRRP